MAAGTREAMWRLPAVDSGPLAWLLRSAALLYGGAVALRALAYDRGWAPVHRLPAKVVSLGNLTVGGTGKTPAALYLAHLLLGAGRRPAILSRGYGGSRARRLAAGWRRDSAGPLVVGDGDGRALAAPEEAGDEPVLLARRAGVPVVVSPDRVAAGRLAIERFGADTLLLDDGFQHRRLARDLDIVLIDARRGLGNGRVLPAGPLRESPGALARADLVLLTKQSKSGRSDALLQALRALAPRAAVFGARHRPVALTPLAPARGAAGPAGEGAPPPPGRASPGQQPAGPPRGELPRPAGAAPTSGSGPSAGPEPAGALAGRRVLALSGLADPASFHELLDELGAGTVVPLAFPDHHRYEAADYERIAAAARGADCLVTTEKDAVKLDPARLPRLPAFALEVVLEPDDPAGFAAACLARLGDRC